MLLNLGATLTDDNCITCTASNCPPPPGFQPNPVWAKASTRQNCQNCNENPLREVNWYDENCFDPTNKCQWVKEVQIECTAGNPPQPYFCYEYQLEECVEEICVDNDGDGYFNPLIGPCFSDKEDCDDDDSAIQTCPECTYVQEELPGIESGSYELNCEICFDGVDNDCANGADEQDYKCLDCYSPVVIDTLGDGFDLTGAEDGVDFDIAGIGRPVRVSWIQGDDAWLALDRNSNGAIDSGRELFGSATSQPGSTGRNGFLALAEYDKPTNAGNGDGVIDSRDAIFSSLRLWLDSNHNGFSEQSELHTLLSMDVTRLDLDYRESGRADSHGNRFRYRTKIYDAEGNNLGRWAWDVFLMVQR